MSEPDGRRPDAPESEGSGPDSAEELAQETQPTPEQPYDVPTGAQQYGQPPASGYQPPEGDPPGAWAPVEGPGPQQYGQPEHGQASYVQEGFPSPYAPPAPGSQQQAYAPQAPYGQPQAPSYGQQQAYAPQMPQAAYGQQTYAPQAPPYGATTYPPQPYGGPAPMSDTDQRLWATLTNISIPFVSFVGPLIAWAILKDRSPFLKDATTEALNFSITVSIAGFVSGLLTLVLVGYVLLPVVYIGALVLAILAAVAANRGEVYRYPLNWRLVK